MTKTVNKIETEKGDEKGDRLVGIGLFFRFNGVRGCASMTPGQKTIVTKDTLPTLKGTWSGWTRFSSVMSSSVLTTLVIDNDTVPLQGKITLENLPGPVAFLFPADFVSAGNSATVNFRNARISSEGPSLVQVGRISTNSPSIPREIENEGMVLLLWV